MKRRVVFIIPGYQESLSLFRYKQVARFFRAKRIKVIPVNIKWKYKVMSDYIIQFKDIFQKNKGQESHFFGFSFGAFIAFASAIELKPKCMILCSLSPYFLEDLKIFPKSWKKGQKKRLLDIRNFEFNKMARKIKSKTYLFVGEKEHKILINRSKEAKKEIKNSSIKIVKGAKHHLSEKYLDEVRKIV